MNSVQKQIIKIQNSPTQEDYGIMRSRIDTIEKNDSYNKKQIQEFDKKVKAM